MKVRRHLRLLIAVFGIAVFLVMKLCNLQESLLRALPSISSITRRNTSRTTTSERTSPSSHDAGVRHWWSNTSQPIIPLIEPTQDGQEEVNQHTNESIYYKPSVGYSFPVNGQGNKWGNHFYDSAVLRYKLEPDVRVWTKQEAMLCLQDQWIHIDGDSLARDVFYDMNEIFGLGWNDKHKTLENLSQGGGFTGNSSERPLITFSSDTIKFRDTPNWYPLLQGVKRGCPDVWIYSSGLWDHPKNTSDAKYYKRTKALANFSASFSDCEIKHKVLRYTTPYQLTSRLMLNERAKRYNEIATELLVPVGFQYVDTFEMLSSRPDLSHDGVHYTGPGSKWVTNSILNLICPSSSS